MLLIEPCVKSQKAYLKLREAGYDTGITENFKSEFNRFTLKAPRLDGRRESGRGGSESGKTLFVAKPLTKQEMMHWIKKDEISLISIDGRNHYLLNESMISLIQSVGKFVELDLSGANSLSIKRVISLSSKLNEDLIVSSCASNFSDLWPVLSKISLLALYGASEGDAIMWVTLNPNILLKRMIKA